MFGGPFQRSSVILIYGRPGHGKTSMIKKLLKKIQFNHIGFIGATLNDSYPEPAFNYVTSQSGDIVPIMRESELDWEKIDSFKNLEGIKVLVMDDILHIETSGHNNAALRDLFSTSRHYDLYIIVGVQLLKSLNKSLRYCCHIFMTGSIDDDSKELLATFTGKKKRDFEGIVIKKYEFLLATIEGNLLKLKPLAALPR